MYVYNNVFNWVLKCTETNSKPSGTSDYFSKRIVLLKEDLCVSNMGNLMDLLRSGMNRDIMASDTEIFLVLWNVLR